jgi:hypothetical protein
VVLGLRLSLYSSFGVTLFWGLSAFACVKDGSEYQQNDIIEWYKLSSLEEKDEEFFVSNIIVEANVLH